METYEKLFKLLEKSGLTLSSAESCTGGNIAHLITLVPGASVYFLGGVVSYSEKIKESVLGVPGCLIKKRGVVSSEVAAFMAEGIRRITGSDFSVSTTGLAGPGGDGSLEEGTVWIGICGPSGTRTFLYETKSNSRESIIISDYKRRSDNIELFTEKALTLLAEYVENYCKREF